MKFNITTVLPALALTVSSFTTAADTFTTDHQSQQELDCEQNEASEVLGLQSMDECGGGHVSDPALDANHHDMTDNLQQGIAIISHR